MYKIGDKVICVEECDMPEFVGLTWFVVRISDDNRFFYCKPEGSSDVVCEPFVFYKHELVPFTSLMQELV